MTDKDGVPGELSFTLATWIWYAHAGGVESNNDGVVGHCRAISAAEDESSGNDAGMALAMAVDGLLGENQDVVAVARGLFGERVHTDLGDGERDDRTRRMRRYQFDVALPWLARIWERTSDGAVAPVWLLVERVTDLVEAMDANPWNEIDEARRVSLVDFHVLWELDECSSISLR